MTTMIGLNGNGMHVGIATGVGDRRQVVRNNSFSSPTTSNIYTCDWECDYRCPEEASSPRSAIVSGDNLDSIGEEALDECEFTPSNPTAGNAQHSISPPVSGIYNSSSSISLPRSGRTARRVFYS